MQTEKEITNSRPIFYFEVLIKNDGKEGDIIIGIGEKDITEKCLSLGSTSHSYGYHSKGKSHNNKKVNKYGENYIKGDIIGCGIDLENKSIFFTKNGKFLDYAFKNVNFEIGKGYLYPSVCMHTLNSEIMINFGKENFKFDVKGYYENNLGKKYSELQKVNPKLDDMDSLVKEYLFHEGYLQTLKSMISKENEESKEKKENNLNNDNNINKKNISETNNNLDLDIDNNMKIDEIEKNENKIIIEDNNNNSMDIEEEFNYEKDENLVENIFKLLVKNKIEEKKENNKNNEKEKTEDKKEEKEKKEEKKEEKTGEKKEDKKEEKKEDIKGAKKIEIVKKKKENEKEKEKEKEKENQDIKENLKKFINFRNKVMNYFSNNEFDKAISILKTQEIKGKEELKKKLYFTIMIMKYITLLKNENNYIECFELLDSFEKEYWDKYKILLFENGSFNETKLFSVQNLATLLSQPDIMNSNDAFFLNEKQINLIENQINSLLLEMFNFSAMSNLGKIIAHLEYMNGLYLKIFNCNQELGLKLD